METANLGITLIGFIYRPPKHTNLDVFNEYIQTILHMLSKTKSPSYIMGDFNIGMLNITDTTTTFLNTMSFFYLKPHIFNPTRLNTEENFTLLIDNIFINSNNDSLSGTIVYDISDHLTIFNSTYIAIETIRNTHGTSQ